MSPDKSPDTPNVLETMMNLQEAKTRSETAIKVVLETEKEKDTTEKAMEELKRHLQPKRTLTHDSPRSTEVSHRQGRVLGSLPSWFCWVDCILV